LAWDYYYYYSNDNVPVVYEDESWILQFQVNLFIQNIETDSWIWFCRVRCRIFKVIDEAQILSGLGFKVAVGSL
jgi:hypothetical protein